MYNRAALCIAANHGPAAGERPADLGSHHHTVIGDRTQPRLARFELTPEIGRRPTLVTVLSSVYLPRHTRSQQYEDRQADQAAPSHIPGRALPSLLTTHHTAAPPPLRRSRSQFTHVKTWSGVVYVAFVVDTFSRRIVGWAAATVKETVFVLDALEMATWQRDRDQYPVQPGELIYHSDAGSQYTSFRLAEHLDAAGIAASIGSVGDAYDNALMESTIGLFKTELIKPRRPWRTPSDVELATAEYVDWYNHRRLHGEIGHVPPVEYENNHYRATTKPQVTTNI
ncbi:IS3 family transposase [Streptomyces microflavus]|uniref:IS3 family transposase n=1 Tax=Streptomyces microflavus TaxID=1919 RepID=UPI003434DDAC